MGIFADAVLRVGGEAQGVIPETPDGAGGRAQGGSRNSMSCAPCTSARADGRSVGCLRCAAGRIRDAGGVLRGGDLDATGSACEAMRNLECAGVLLASAPDVRPCGEQRFLKPENRALVLARDQPADLLQTLEEWRPSHVEKRLSRETR